MDDIKICPICNYLITKKRDDLFCTDVCKQKDFRNKRNDYYDKELSDKELSLKNKKIIRKFLEFRLAVLEIRYKKDLDVWLKEQKEKGIEVIKSNEEVWWKYACLQYKMGLNHYYKEYYYSINENDFDFQQYKHHIENKTFL